MKLFSVLGRIASLLVALALFAPLAVSALGQAAQIIA